MDVYSVRYNLYDISCIKASHIVSVWKVFKKAFLNLFICSKLKFFRDSAASWNVRVSLYVR